MMDLSSQAMLNNITVRYFLAVPYQSELSQYLTVLALQLFAYGRNYCVFPY